MYFAFSVWIYDKYGFAVRHRQKESVERLQNKTAPSRQEPTQGALKAVMHMVSFFPANSHLVDHMAKFQNHRPRVCQ